MTCLTHGQRRHPAHRSPAGNGCVPSVLIKQVIVEKISGGENMKEEPTSDLENIRAQSHKK